jgi:hypothetical protein
MVTLPNVEGTNDLTNVHRLPIATNGDNIIVFILQQRRKKRTLAPATGGNQRRVVGGGRRRVTVGCVRWWRPAELIVFGLGLWLLGEGSMTNDLRGDARGWQ